jgi:hypothetical protein
MQMASTDHYVQTTLAPNSRIRVEGKEDTGVFLGPKGDSSSIFSSPLTVQYSVSSTSTDSSPRYISSAAGDTGGDLDFGSCSSKITKSLDFPNGSFSEFFASFPPTIGQSNLISRPSDCSDGSFSKPFDGKTPSVSQIAAVSSAAAGLLSHLVPSTLNQVLLGFP